jgi:DNA-binding LacI/PurR family transcriptional regulator
MAAARRVTIYDIAEQAGVAASTVSRALRNPQRVHPATREEILRVAERLGYRGDSSHRGVQGRSTQMIAMLVTDITNPHYFDMIRGAERRAKAAGVTLVLVNTEESPQNEQHHVERLVGSVDGFILASSRMTDEAIRALAARAPLVLMSRQLAGLPSSVVEHQDGSRQIVEHLASLGHRRVAILAGPRASWIGAQRWRAVSTEAERLGVEVARLGPFLPSVEGGGAAADAAVGSGATAAIAHNDLLAIGVMQRLVRRGLQVPGDMSVVGFDDTFAAGICSPGLTTLGGPHDEAARFAVELLLEGRRNGRVVLPSQLVIRDSTGPARSA